MKPKTTIGEILAENGIVKGTAKICLILSARFLLYIALPLLVIYMLLSIPC